MYAALFNNLEAIKLPLAHTSATESFPMVEAATSGNPQILELLIAWGGNPNGNGSGQTPLMEAINWGICLHCQSALESWRECRSHRF